MFKISEQLRIISKGLHGPQKAIKVFVDYHNH